MGVIRYPEWCSSVQEDDQLTGTRGNSNRIDLFVKKIYSEHIQETELFYLLLFTVEGWHSMLNFVILVLGKYYLNLLNPNIQGLLDYVCVVY